jgi:fructose-1-phosphate kinase PfkB-like protein
MLCVCLNPTVQKTITLPRMLVGEVNRASAVRTDASGKGVNVARVLVQLGEADVVHLTHLGDGPNAQLFSALAAAD